MADHAGSTATRPLALAIAAVAEAITGLALLAFPQTVVQMLFGTEVVGAGITMTRIAGISLIALGLACWPWSGSTWGLGGMLAYSSLVALYLLSVGL